MGLRILYDASENMAALYDSTSDFAFGPVFYGGEHHEDANDRALRFVRWLPIDARAYDSGELERFYGEWLSAGEPGGAGGDDDDQGDE